jgi:hypothetical protein
MTTELFEILWICLIILAVLAAIAVLVAGVICLTRYARTRVKKFLIAGLILTLLLPGCLYLIGLVVWLPNAFMGYGPPPSNYVP